MMTESFSCVLCDEKFPDRDCLREHFRSHGTKKETLPKVIPKVAPKQIASFTTCTPSRCEICDTPCSSINFYWQHYRTCHPYWRGVDCAHCGKHFLHNADYTRHSKDHEGLSEEQVFDCSMCDSTFFNKAAVEIHKAGHEHVTNLQNKAKDNQTSKMERVPNALKMKANYCKPCNCQFVNSSALAQHLVTHSLYICLVCGKEMSDDETFRNHQKVHLPTSSTKTSGTADSKSPKAKKRKK